MTHEQKKAIRKGLEVIGKLWIYHKPSAEMLGIDRETATCAQRLLEKLEGLDKIEKANFFQSLGNENLPHAVADKTVAGQNRNYGQHQKP